MQLRLYQEIGRDFLAARPRAYLADGMRVGKTPQAIAAAHAAGAKSINVICPAIARPHWEREFRRWWPGVMSPRRLITSYDMAARDTAIRYSSDVLIVDEAHFCKTPTAKRTKAVFDKGGWAWKAGAIWCLSGTPAPNHAAELCTVAQAYGLTKLGYRAFAERYCRVSHMPFRIHGTRTERIPELHEMFEPVMLRRTIKDVAPELAAIDYQLLALEGDRKVILDFPAHLSIEELLDHAGSFTTARRLCAEGKAGPLAQQIINDMEGGLDQTVVFGYFRDSLDTVRRLLLAAGISAEIIDGGTYPREREQIQNRFKLGITRVIVAQIIAAGTAIDLSSASHGYFLDLDWVPGNNVQAAHRLVSMDKTDPVSFDVAVWAGSPDEHVNNTLRRKVKELSQLF